MSKAENELKLQWFAARVVGGPAPLSSYLEREAVRSYSTPYAGGIIFIRCPKAYIKPLLGEFWGKLFFYLNPERTEAQPVDDRQMNSFILVTSNSDELISLGEVTADFLVGERVRVTAGPFEGAEGVIKRIKGDRRLVVSIDGVTAVATCHIRTELLERVGQTAPK